MVQDPKPRIPVAVLGATGLVGQRLVSSLVDHPWFELVEVAASERSAHRSYQEATNWRLPGGVPEALREMEVQPAHPARVSAPLVFSALDAKVAFDLESAFAHAGRGVVSNARSFRMEEDVPLVVPEVNADHLDLIETQRARRGWSGFIVTNPNCSTIGLALALAPLHRAAKVRRVVVTTMQAASGAGYPGVPALDLIDNVIPEIAGEEDKMARESPKILGRLHAGSVEECVLSVSAHTHRVGVQDGHLLSVSVETVETLTPERAREHFRDFRGEPQERALPSAPRIPIHVLDAPHRPQPRLDRDREKGMAISVGRIGECPVLGIRFEALSHNTLRGAAGGTLLIAELLVARGWRP